MNKLKERTMSFLYNWTTPLQTMLVPFENLMHSFDNKLRYYPRYSFVLLTYMDIQAPRISKAFPEEICEENSKMVRKKCRIRTIPG
jgi:hypothetical protein